MKCGETSFGNSFQNKTVTQLLDSALVYVTLAYKNENGREVEFTTPQMNILQR
jgi:hypothetical protein